jgi:hypothetical protein
VTFQGHRYGWCPFPSKIERVEFERILSAAQSSEIVDDAKLSHLREPYWKLDVSSEPQLYVLQPISHMPGCGAYIISEEDQIQAAQDAVFKVDREKKRNDASYRYWGRGKIFDSIQEVLREGSKALPMEQREKYIISVTHDEVNRGILHNPNCNEQALYFERIIEGIDAELASEDKQNSAIASSFKDSIPIDKDPSGRRMPNTAINAILEDMQKVCKAKMSPSNIVTHTVPWVCDGKMSKDNDEPPPEWFDYLDSFASKLLTSVCESLFRQ